MMDSAIPPHAFMAAMLIVTPELQRWASEAVASLGAAGHQVPADLVLLRDGCAVSQFRWLWLVDEVRAPRRACPF